MKSAIESDLLPRTSGAFRDNIISYNVGAVGVDAGSEADN